MDHGASHPIFSRQTQNLFPNIPAFSTNPNEACFCFFVKTTRFIKKFGIGYLVVKSAKIKYGFGAKNAEDKSPLLNPIIILLSFTSFIRSTVMSKPVYHDLWGYSVNWTDPSDGWDQARNSEYLDRKAV